MAETKSWQGVNFTTPKQVSGRDSMRTFSRNDGKEMAEITLPAHTEITLPNGEKKDVSFHKFIVPKSSVQEFENDASNFNIAMPFANRDGEPWKVTLIQEKGMWEHPEAEGKDRGEFIITERNAVMLNSEQFAQDMDANCKERSDWAKNHDISEQQVEKSKSKKGAYFAPDTPVEDTSSETKERTKQKSTSLREATKEAKAASEQLSKEAKSAPAKEAISIDNGVSL